MTPEEKDEPDDAIEEDDGTPTTMRSDRLYQKLVKSERATVPPPAQSHIRDLLGRIVDDDDVLADGLEDAVRSSKG